MLRFFCGSAGSPGAADPQEPPDAPPGVLPPSSLVKPVHIGDPDSPEAMAAVTANATQGSDPPGMESIDGFQQQLGAAVEEPGAISRQQQSFQL